MSNYNSRALKLDRMELDRLNSIGKNGVSQKDGLTSFSSLSETSVVGWLAQILKDGQHNIELTRLSVIRLLQ